MRVVQFAQRLVAVLSIDHNAGILQDGENMPLKYFNQSGLPDEPMKTLLLKAMRAAGAHGSVIVKVTRGGWRTGSIAYECRAVRRSFINPKSKSKSMIKTDGGYIIMRPVIRPDSLDMAERFFKTAIHEFSHIRDYQRGGSRTMAWSRGNRAGRRPKWGKRPEEIRAQDNTDEALKRLNRRRESIDDLILALALQFDAKWPTTPATQIK